MRNKVRIGALLFLATIALPVSAPAAEASKGSITALDIANTPPSATLEFEARQVRLILGGGLGTGVLRFGGKEYPFTLKALGVGVVDVSEVHGAGNVYFLERVEDFAGTYRAVGASVALGGGRSAASYENNKGVHVSVRSKTTGVALNLGVGGVQVELSRSGD